MWLCYVCAVLAVLHMLLVLRQCANLRRLSAAATSRCSFVASLCVCCSGSVAHVIGLETVLKFVLAQHSCSKLVQPCGFNTCAVQTTLHILSVLRQCATLCCLSTAATSIMYAVQCSDIHFAVKRSCCTDLSNFVWPQASHHIGCLQCNCTLTLLSTAANGQTPSGP